jgi:hypothetical protein
MTKKLTASLLRQIVKEEAAKFGGVESTEDVAKETEEVEPEDVANTLEKQIDYVKALKVEESRLVKKLNRLREVKTRSLKRLVKKVSQ